MALAGLCWLISFTGSLQADGSPYIATDPADANSEPPVGGGDGWLGGANKGAGVIVNAGQTIWVASRNQYANHSWKVWTLTLTPTSGAEDLKNLTVVDGSGIGFNPDLPNSKAFNLTDVGLNPDKITMEFNPQPVWERVALRNKGSVAISFTIESSWTCPTYAVIDNTLRMESCVFGAEDGVPPTNQVYMFPQTIPLDPSTKPAFSAPTDSGKWTASLVYKDPDGNLRPRGGVLFDAGGGPGLKPGESCSFSFAMQGPAADLQYTMYAYDKVMQKFQQFDLDLRPALAIDASSNGIGLRFPSVLELNYTLESSANLVAWQPLQSFSGTGKPINGHTSISGTVAFYRLRCEPSTNSINGFH